VINRVTVKAPVCTACELPILTVLRESPDSGIEAKAVIREVIKWFDRLDEQDVNARYEKSRKKITQSIIKYAKKNLALKAQIYQAGEGKPIGIWRITEKGSQRVAKDKDAWMPKYHTHDAVIEEMES
jgi:hypothetical protein